MGITMKNITDMVRNVFGKKQNTFALDLGVSESQLSNAINGKRHIGKYVITPALLAASMKQVEDDSERTYSKEAIVTHLRKEKLLYPDIEKASDKSYKDVIMAMMNHYSETAKIAESFDDLFAQGQVYYNNGNYDQAIRCLEEAELLGADQKKNEMELHKVMANAHLKKGDYASAITRFGDALYICEHLEGNDSFDVARLHQRIGVVLRKNKEYEEATENFKKAEKIISKLLEVSPNDHKIADLYNGFAVLHLNEKNFEDAYDNYKKAYGIREKNYEVYGRGDGNLHAIKFYFSVHNLGTYYNKLATENTSELSEDERLEHLTEASRLHEKAYNFRLSLLDGEDVLVAAMPKNPLSEICLDIAQTLTLWASDLSELGELNEALEKCKLGLKIREAKYGEGAEIPEIAWSFYTLGLIHEKLGENDEALNCFEKSYRIRRNMRNGDHPYAAKVLFQIGRIKSITSPHDALITLRKAYDIQKRVLKSNDPELFETKEMMQKLGGQII